MISVILNVRNGSGCCDILLFKNLLQFFCFVGLMVYLWFAVYDKKLKKTSIFLFCCKWVKCNFFKSYNKGRFAPGVSGVSPLYMNKKLKKTSIYLFCRK